MCTTFPYCIANERHPGFWSSICAVRCIQVFALLAEGTENGSTGWRVHRQEAKVCSIGTSLLTVMLRATLVGRMDASGWKPAG